MEQKRVSYKIAKAIKEAGYPQDKVTITEIGWYNKARVYTNELPTFWEGDNMFVAVAPTYFDVWLWLWRKKNIRFDVEDLWDAALSYPERGCASNTNQLGGICTPESSDPEEAIIAAIEYLVDNNLIK